MEENGEKGKGRGQYGTGSSYGLGLWLLPASALSTAWRQVKQTCTAALKIIPERRESNAEIVISNSNSHPDLLKLFTSLFLSLLLFP